MTGSITGILSTCCQDFVSFLEGCPLWRVSLKKGTTVVAKDQYSALLFPWSSDGSQNLLTYIFSIVWCYDSLFL